MNLDYFVIVDCGAGTFFGADNAFLLDTRKLSEGVDAAEHFYDGTDEAIEWLQSVAQEAA